MENVYIMMLASKSYKAIAWRRCIYCNEEFRKPNCLEKQCLPYLSFGDDVLGLEWYTKMGSIGGEVLEGIQKSIALAEEKYKGLGDCK